LYFSVPVTGVLYNWPAAMTACPAGWHLPSDAEWTQLEDYLANNGHNFDGTTGGGRKKIGKSMASRSGWDKSRYVGSVGSNDYKAYRNKSGFSALPGGYHSSDEIYLEVGWIFNDIGRTGFWWSSTEGNPSYAWYRGLSYSSSNVYRDLQLPKEHGFSVRCLRDE